MNFLALYESEKIDDSKVILRDERAKHAIVDHELAQGLEVAAFFINGARCHAYVDKVLGDEVHLTVSDFSPALPILPVELIVAVPRPQTVRKVIQIAATFGVKALHLIRSEKVVKSYLASKRLEKDAVLEDLLLGMEQSGTSFMPEVKLHPLFVPFIEEYLTVDQNSLALIADTHEAIRPAKLLAEKYDKLFLAIGPESGWNEFEVERFKEKGFKGVSLGDRVLRVETACVALLAQV